MEKIVKLTKEILNNNGNIEALQEELNKELTPVGKLSIIHELIKDNKVDEKSYEFMLKLISKDDELYTQLNELKKFKKTEQEKKDLEKLNKNLEETKKELLEQINSLQITIAPKTNIPLLKNLEMKTLISKNKEIIETKLKQIIKIIQTIKKEIENEKTKSIYKETKSLIQLLDYIQETCKIANLDDLEKIKERINNEFQISINNLAPIISAKLKEYRGARFRIETFDKRLIDYVKKKKCNYITLAVDTLSEKNIFNYNSETKELIFKEPSENTHELLIYAIIALNLTNEKTTIKLTYIPKNENTKPETNENKPKIYTKKR